jgi:hypothetical protein
MSSEDWAVGVAMPWVTKWRRRDNALTAATIVIFWPAAFFVGGDRASATGGGRLKGELDALDAVSAFTTDRSCSLRVYH